MKKIAVIGAGISGLSTAYGFQKGGDSVTVFERSSEVGGAMRSCSENGYLYEFGPNSLMLNDARIKDFIEELGLADEVIEADESSKKRFVIKDGKPMALPSSPFSLIGTKLFSMKAKLRLFREPFVRKAKDLDEQSFADFIRHRLGDEMLDYAAGPFVSGIYAGDAEKLSFRHAFPRLYKIVAQHGSLVKGMIKARKTPNPHKLAKRKIISFKQGMQSIPDALLEKIGPENVVFNAENGIIERLEKDQWRYSWMVDGEIHQEDFDHIYVTTPTHQLDKLTLPAEVKLPKTKALYYPPVASLFLGFKREDVEHPLDGFGMLVGVPESCDVLGALFTSTLFPNQGRAPEGHVGINVMLGGAKTPEKAELSEEELISASLKELSSILGITGKPTFQNVKVWKQAIPQVGKGHGDVLAELEKIEKEHPGIHFLGNYRNGISVGDCILNGLAAAEA